MNISEFINAYYIKPILEHEGYNTVNTLTYAIIAIGALYLIYSAFKKYSIKVDRQFVFNTLPFVLLGSTVRVVTDSLDTGVMKPATLLHEFVINSRIYDYGFASSSPGIYIVTAALFLLALFLGRKIKKPEITGWIGIALSIPHLFILLFFVQYPLFVIPILLLAAIPSYIIFRHFKKRNSKSGAANPVPQPDILAGIVGAHALDGAATFIVIDYFSGVSGRAYFEQHVLPSFIGETFNSFFPFYLIKVGIAAAAAYFISSDKDSKDEEKMFICLVLIIIGLAPGIRDALRMMVGA